MKPLLLDSPARGLDAARVALAEPRRAPPSAAAALVCAVLMTLAALAAAAVVLLGGWEPARPASGEVRAALSR